MEDGAQDGRRPNDQTHDDRPRDGQRHGDAPHEEDAGDDRGQAGLDEIERRARRLRIQVIHGPNLNLLGTREPEIYGRETLADIEARLRALGTELDLVIDSMQSNHEGELIDAIHQAIGAADGIIINAGSLGHSSIGLRDALVAAPPAVDVHVSAIHARESFRRESMIAPVCMATLSGFGARGYELALRGLAAHLRAGADAEPRRRASTEGATD